MKIKLSITSLKQLEELESVLINEENKQNDNLKEVRKQITNILDKLMLNK